MADDRKITWSIVAKFQNLMREAKKADRALEDLEDRNESWAASSTKAAKAQSQNSAIISKATQRHTAAVDSNTQSLSRWQAMMVRVADARKREVEQSALVSRARADEATALDKLEKAQNKHVDAVKRSEEVAKRASATEYQKGRALAQVKEALQRVTAAQQEFNVAQQRTTTMVSRTTKEVDRSRTVWGRYKKDSASAWGTLRKGGGVLAGLAKGFAMLAVKAAVVIPLVLGLASAAVQLVGGATAMVSALAPAVGILATLPQLALGAATAVGSLVAAFSGVGGALKAYGKQQDALSEKEQKARAEMSASERAAAEYNDALMKLPKSSRNFVKYLVSQKDKLEQLKKAAADGLMPGAEKGLRSLMKLFPSVQSGVAGMSKALGDSFAALGKAMTTDARRAQFGRLMESNTYVAKQFGSVMKNLVLITMSVADAARPLTEWLARLAAGWASNTRKMAESAEGGRKMQRFFDATKKTLQTWGNILKNVGIGLKNIGVAGYESGQSLTESFEGATEKFREWTEKDYNKTKLKKFFDDSKTSVETIGRIVKDLGGIFGGLVMPGEGKEAIGGGFLKSIEDMMPTLKEIITTLSENMGTGIIDAIKSLLEAFNSFLKNGGAEALGTFSDVVAELAGGIKKVVEIPGVAQTIAGIAAAFGAFKALKFISTITGISSLGRAIAGFYRDAKRPKGAPDPADFGMGTGGGRAAGGTGGAYFPGGGGSGNAPTKKPRRERGSIMFPGATAPTSKKKPGGRLAGKGRTIGRAAGAAGAVAALTYFAAPDSAAGQAGGMLSSVLSVATVLPMALSPLGGLFKRSGKEATGWGAKIKGVFGKIGEFVKGIGPKFKSVFGGIGTAFKSVGVWVKGLASSFASFAKMLGSGILRGLQSFGTLLKTIGSGIGSFVRTIGSGFVKAFSFIGRIIGTIGRAFLQFATKILPMVGRAFLLLGRAMLANPLGLIITAIVALVAAFVLLYKKNEAFRNFINKVWAAIKVAIGAVVDWLVNTAWPWLKGVFENIGKVIGWLWTNIVQPTFKLIWAAVKAVFGWILNTAWPWMKTAFAAIGAVIGWLWNNIVKPYFTMIWTIAKAVFGWILNTGWPLLRSAFNFIGKIIGWLWNTIVKPYFTLIWNIVKTVFQWILNTGWPLLKKAFDAIATGAKWLWEKGIKPAFNFIKTGVEGLVKVFTTVRDSIGRVWNGLVGKISGPINTVVTWINKNFIGKINQLLGKLGLSWRLPSIGGGTGNGSGSAGSRSLLGGVQKAKGGYIPGHSPTATSDNIPAWLTAGEFVTRVQATKKMQRKHPGVLEHINRTGDLPQFALGGAFGVSPIQAAWFKRIGIAKGIKVDTKPERRYASGGYVAGAPSAAHAFASKYGIGGIIGEAFEFFKDAGGWAKAKVNALLAKLGLKEFLRYLASGVGGKALAGMAEWAKNKMLEFFGEGGNGGTTGGARVGNTLARVRALIASSGIPGLSITSTYRSPARNAAVGGSPTSKHMNAANPAVDVGGPHSSLDRLYVAARAVDKWAQLLWQVAGHYDHIHFSARGGLVPDTRLARGGRVRGVGNRDTIPAMLTPGEFVLRKSAVKALDPKLLERLNGVAHGMRPKGHAYGLYKTHHKPKGKAKGWRGDERFPRLFHAGGPVSGFAPGGSGTWVKGLYRMLMEDLDITVWGSDLSARLSRWFGTGSSPFPPDSWVAPWAARLREWATLTMPKTLAAFSNFMNVPGAGPINFQTLKWLKWKDLDAWGAVKASTKASSVWLESKYGTESAEAKSAFYALQQRLKFGSDGTKLDNSLGGFTGFLGPSGAESEAINHAIAHALGLDHDPLLARPWGPARTEEELAVVAQRTANAQLMELSKLLDVFSTWGLTDLVQHLLEQKDAGDVTTTADDGSETTTTGLQTALNLAKTYSSNRPLAEAYNAALRDAADLASGASLQYAKFISLISTSSDPVGIRALARAIGVPDFGVVQMYEKLLSTGRITKSSRTARLDREVALFKSGLFYAATGGAVPGSGGGDKVPAMLTPGEYVLRKAAVKALGLDYVASLNRPQRFANGGLVFPVTPATPAIPASVATAVRRGISPAAGHGIINIRTNIYNPVRETSTASMHRMLRQQAAQGLFGESMTTATVVVKPEGGSA
jgi:phage-related protein